MNSIEQRRYTQDRLFFAVALFFISAAVINRIYGTGSTSDMVPHLNFSKQLFTPENVIAYPLFHLLVLALEKLFTLKWAGIFVQSGCYVLTYFIVDQMIARLIPKETNCTADSSCSMNTPFAAFLFAFLSPIYLPWIMPNIYLGQGGMQIWHNPTLTVAVPFALILIYQFTNLFAEKHQHIPATKFIAFATLLFVSNLAKPSFYIAFAPAVFLFLLIDLIAEKFKTIIFCVKIGVSFIPATILFCYQTFFFDSNTKFSFSISPFTVWNVFSPNILLSIGVGLAFPLMLIILLWNRVKGNKPLLFCVLITLIAIVEFAVFTDGTRAGNFGWGYYMCQYAIFIYAFTLWMKEKSGLIQWKNNILSIFFLLHLFSGFCYLVQIFQNGRFLTLVNGKYY